MLRFNWLEIFQYTDNEKIETGRNLSYNVYKIVDTFWV